MFIGKWQPNLGILAIGMLMVAQSTFLAAAPLTIAAGYDLFHTTGAALTFETQPIPGNFFDPGSQDFVGLVPLAGTPLTTYNGIPLPLPSPTSPENQVDTIVHRIGDVTLPTIGSSATTSVEIVDISLHATIPIQVTNASSAIELWDVDFRGTNNPVGSITIQRDFDNGGIYNAILPVTGILTFTRQSDSVIRILDIAAAGIPPKLIEVVNAPWLESPIFPSPNDNFMVTSITGLTTNFVPGYTSGQGRIALCGANTQNPTVEHHGHVATSPTSIDFFPSDPCVAQVPEPSVFVLFTAGIPALFAFSSLRRFPRRNRRYPAEYSNGPGERLRGTA